MPTPWKRSAEELHKTYISNTEAFYKAVGRGLSGELDEFITNCALGLWQGSPAITEAHVECANQLYSKGTQPPKWLLWDLTEKVCSAKAFLPPLFFWNMTDADAKRGTENSRIFVRMLTNILLYLAAADDEVTVAEAAYITDCTDKLTALCDGAGVRKSKAPLNAAEYVTSGEESFTVKNAAMGVSVSGEKSKETAPAEQSRPSLEELLEQ